MVHAHPLWEWKEGQPVIDYKMDCQLLALYQQHNGKRRSLVVYREATRNGPKNRAEEVFRSVFLALVEQHVPGYCEGCKCPKRHCGTHYVTCQYFTLTTLPDLPGATPGNPDFDPDEFARRA